MSEQVHQNQPVLNYGTPLSEARAAVILLHGRGSTAQNILGLAAQFPQEGIAYFAPQAANQTWYPNSGFIPLEANEPYISSAFHVLSVLIAHINEAGIGTGQLALGGFSQGACLSAEFVARHAQRYGGLFVLSGALLGPLDMPRAYEGSLEGTPVYVGGCERDPWVTAQQLRMTGQVLQDLGAAVQVEVQPDAGHTVRAQDIEQVRAMLARLTA